MTHPDLESLFQTLLPFTQELLGKYGGFNPWGAVMYTDGGIQWVGADTGEDFPPAEELIKLLAENFQQQSARGALRAAGICYDARVVPPGKSQKSDAICCSLEHISGEAVNVFVPYSKANNGIEYAEAFSWPRDSWFFLPVSGTQ